LSKFHWADFYLILALTCLIATMLILSQFHEEKQSKYSYQDPKKCTGNNYFNYKKYCLLVFNARSRPLMIAGSLISKI
jgi:hypothetical protein